ncbi:hypothetical protein LINPERPRIM_LOCUS40839 [Linum perenne]
MRDLGLYFGCPHEKEGKGCGFYEKLEVQEAVDDAKKEKDKIIQRKNEQLNRCGNRIKELKEENNKLTNYVDRLVKNKPLWSYCDDK